MIHSPIFERGLKVGVFVVGFKILVAMMFCEFKE